MPAPPDRFHPIIFVRGYAGTADEVEDTVATPYMGFNDGSTKIRQSWDGSVIRHIFESPLVRLMKDHGYVDIYEQGAEIDPAKPLPRRSIVIFRYYDRASRDLGLGIRDDVEHYATGLGELILSLRARVAGAEPAARDAFRVNLVAHSMGGLICRCLLQNPAINTHAAALIDKVFTYATPHNGIDVALIGNVPAGILSRNNSDTFNRGRMRQYLALPPVTADNDRVDSLNRTFPPERFFCLVGTNHRDYAVAGGAVRRVVGEMSDGLVRIANAAVDDAPRAFVHRSHSGHYGILNSEEGYQNLQRFLFGDLRVDGVLRVDELSLPPAVQKKYDERDSSGRRRHRIRASYHFECIVRVRGTRFDLHRRLREESSAIFRRFDELFPRDGTRDEVASPAARHPHLFSLYLSSAARVNTRRRSLGFSVDIRVHVPEYTVDGALFFDHHYEGSYLYRDTLTLEVTPGEMTEGGPQAWSLRWGLDSATPGRATKDATLLAAPPGGAGGTQKFEIPLASGTRPGLAGALELTLSPWNH